MDGVATEEARQIHRYDMFQAAARAKGRAVVVSSVGAAIVSDDRGESWTRYELPGRPALIDVTACASGDFFALDNLRHVWQLPVNTNQWTATVIDTPENTLSIRCAPGNHLWVSASFGTLYSRDIESSDWIEFSLNEDLQFTAVRFVDENTGFAVGEFGTVIKTTDGGKTWEQRTPVPNEFYPMGVDFVDADTGWVGGLDGVIWQTGDGGQTWQRQESLTASPIYNIVASDRGVYAVGGSAKLVELVGGRWQKIQGAPEVLAFIRGLVTFDDGSLLVAGGGGTLAIIPPAKAG